MDTYAVDNLQDIFSWSKSALMPSIIIYFAISDSPLCFSYAIINYLKLINCMERAAILAGAALDTFADINGMRLLQLP